jgi:transposase
MATYSLDLRRRIFGYSLSHSVRETAHVFQVSPSTVQALRQLFIETGELDPRPPGAARPRVVSEEGGLYIQLLLRETVDLTLEELCDRYAETYGVRPSVTAMHATLKRLGITRKKSLPMTRKRTHRRVGLKPNAITAKSMKFPLISASIWTKPEPA